MCERADALQKTSNTRQERKNVIDFFSLFKSVYNSRTDAMSNKGSAEPPGKKLTLFAESPPPLLPPQDRALPHHMVKLAAIGRTDG